MSKNKGGKFRLFSRRIVSGLFQTRYSLLIMLFLCTVLLFWLNYFFYPNIFLTKGENKISEEYQNSHFSQSSSDSDANGEIANSSTIEDSINNVITSLKGVYGVYIKNIDSGGELGIGENTIFDAASLNKLFVAGVYYKELEENPALRNQVLELRNEDKVDDMGSLSSAPAGSFYPLETLISLMLKESNNIAFSITTRYLEFQKIVDFINLAGLTNTDFVTNTTTPSDIGVFLEKLYKNELFSREDSEEMIGLLTHTAFEDRLPYYLPQGVKVAHKIGTGESVYSDAGIVFRPKNHYIIVVMTKDADYSQAVEAIRKISKITYDYFSS